MEHDRIMPTDATTTTTALPRIGRVECDRTDGQRTATCWFESGAQLRYRERPDGVVVEEVCRADDPDRVIDATEIGHPDDHPDISVCTCLVDSLDVYHDYRVEEGADALRTEWPTLAAGLAPE